MLQRTRFGWGIGLVLSLPIVMPWIAPRLMAADSPVHRLPPETVLALEIPQPARLTGPLLKWLPGSVLADPLAAIESARDAAAKHAAAKRNAAQSPKTAPDRDIPEPADVTEDAEEQLDRPRMMLALWGALVSPESLADVSKAESFTLAFVKLPDHPLPRGVLLIRTGQSQTLPILMRSWMIYHPSLRPLPKIGEFRLMREFVQEIPDANDDAPPDSPPPMPKERTDVLTIATAPGWVIVGDHVDLVKQMIDRVRSAPAANQCAAIGELSRENPTIWLQTLKFFQNSGISRLFDPSLLGGLNDFVLPASQVKPITLELIPQGETLQLIARMPLSDSRGPLLELLRSPGQAAPAMTPTTAPASPPATGSGTGGDSAGGVVTWALPPGEETANRLLQFADRWAKAHGVIGALPSEWVDGLAQQNPPIRLREALASVQTIRLQSPARGEQVVVLQLPEKLSAIAAEALPELMTRLRGERSQPVSERIDGMMVQSYVIPGWTWGERIHVGSVAGRVAMGSSRATVAAALKQSLDQSPPQSRAIQGRIPWKQLVPSPAPTQPPAQPTGKKPHDATIRMGLPGGVPGGVPGGFVPSDLDLEMADDADIAREIKAQYDSRHRRFAQAIAAVPPLQLSVQTTPQHVEFRIQLDGMPKLFPAVSDFVLFWLGMEPGSEWMADMELLRGPIIID
ncbi:hypothetical protein [Tuwongella immobilis]|nr:hypothetical protein [Tuwongella immobilis]